MFNDEENFFKKRRIKQEAKRLLLITLQIGN